MTNSNYTLLTSRAIRREPTLLPQCGGIYFIILDKPAALNRALERAGASLSRVSLSSRPILYVGCARTNLRQRIWNHVRGDSRVSSFRGSLGSLLASELRLSPHDHPSTPAISFGAGERALSRWLDRNVTVAFRCCANPALVERELIRRATPLLNLEHQICAPIARTISAIRREMRAGKERRRVAFESVS